METGRVTDTPHHHTHTPNTFIFPFLRSSPFSQHEAKEAALSLLLCRILRVRAALPLPWASEGRDKKDRL